MIFRRRRSSSHHHRCAACGAVWEHLNAMIDQIDSHKCPGCGRIEWRRHVITAADVARPPTTEARA